MESDPDEGVALDEGALMGMEMEGEETDKETEVHSEDGEDADNDDGGDDDDGGADDDEEDERESILLPTVDRLSDPDFSNVPDLTYWLPAITTALHSGDHRCVTPFPFSLLKLL